VHHPDIKRTTDGSESAADQAVEPEDLASDQAVEPTLRTAARLGSCCEPGCGVALVPRAQVALVCPACRSLLLSADMNRHDVILSR